jgi:hypothetical protein
VTRGVTTVLFLATAALLGAQAPSTSSGQARLDVDPAKLEAIRKMTPEQRAELKRRLEEIKKLSAEERERLSQNLQKIKSMPVEEVKKLKEKEQHLTKEDQKAYAELAQGFFHWTRKQGYAEAFPRGLFFAWLKRERAEEMKAIQEMDAGVQASMPGVASPRVDTLMKLSYQFRDVMLERTERHVARHKCAPYEAVHELRDSLAPREFWPKWKELQRGCDARRANPGPVPPRPIDPPRK